MTKRNFINYSEQSMKFDGTAIDIMLALTSVSLSGCDTSYHAIYEKAEEWSIGLGKYASITATKNQVTLTYDETVEIYENENLSVALNNATSSIPIKSWRLYGNATFELSHVFYDLEKQPSEDETLLKLFIPTHEVRINKDKGTASLRTIKAEELPSLIEAFANIVQEQKRQPTTSIDYVKADLTDSEHFQQESYKNSVHHAIDEINTLRYQKVILSRRVPIPSTTNLVESYRYGHKINTPARSFLLSYDDFGLAGFSPEIVVEVSKGGWVSTRPLAGTRALGNSEEEENKLRTELLNDTKEIAEHAVSVKLAQDELTPICQAESVVVSEFMGIRRRSSVQHLMSCVKGKLNQDYTAWDAFKALFPGVTSSGIPKKEAIEAIQRHENLARGAYSGSVIILDSDGQMDAALVLRSIYKVGNNYWLQAGAGIVGQSEPDRELEETNEKLSCVVQSIMLNK